ncbi:DODA-type extradiol aromatic ring-opening family dioxygenase [Salinibius halmophilus]|uniref:DODA-type extradiol aromatic ring-opening family dioxygenase n=1 Tax=Salinibius halmophilus TaxID=1853216 RepID=UPI000E6623CD|nr:class III extradiol ring-cleavage dioxygenase [Salinibius halmophilus]
MQAPVIFIPHGGGPLPLTDDVRHEALRHFLTGLPSLYGKPDAIVVISAHWQTTQPTLQMMAKPPMIYDYHGFPESAYQIQYPAPGAPTLATEIATHLSQQGFSAKLDEQRGFDHGVFVPLMLMYPEADIPVLQLSLMENMDPAAHLALGRALQDLRHRNIMVIGSGMSFHNLDSFFVDNDQLNEADYHFTKWLIDVCTNPKYSAKERKTKLINWLDAPYAQVCHPTPEHLMPLHVCVGAAEHGEEEAEVIFDGDVLGKRVCALNWFNF